MKATPPPPPLERPLSLGEIVDRALSLLISSWRPILTLATIGYLPFAALSYWAAARWLTLTSGAGPSLIGPQFVTVAAMTFGSLVAIDAGPWRWIVGIGGQFLSLVMACAIAIVVLGRRAGLSTSAADALRSVNLRWEVVAPVAAIGSLMIYGSQMASFAIGRGAGTYFGLGRGTAGTVASYVMFILVGVAFHLVQFTASVCAVAAGFGSGGLAEAVGSAAGALFGRGRIALTFWLGVALFASVVPVGIVDILGAAVLRLTRIALPTTVIFALINVLFAAFVALVACLYYSDGQLRHGVNVMAAFAKHEGRGEEAF